MQPLNPSPLALRASAFELQSDFTSALGTLNEALALLHFRRSDNHEGQSLFVPTSLSKCVSGLREKLIDVEAHRQLPFWKSSLPNNSALLAEFDVLSSLSSRLVAIRPLCIAEPE